MILTCPECSTRYLAKDDAIGPNGRTVRCAKCDATWFVSADPDALALQDNQSVPEIVPMDHGSSSGLTREERENLVADFNDNVDLNAAQDELGAHVSMRDRADQQKRNARLRSVGMIWAVPLLILAFATILAYRFRQDIVNRIPATATLYQSLNIPVKFSGLDFEEVVSDFATIDGQSVLVVNGTIKNVTNKPRPVPMVEMSFHDVGGNKLLSWMVDTEVTEIKPRERIEFVTEYPNPPIDAVKLRYKIDDSSSSSGQG